MAGGPRRSPAPRPGRRERPRASARPATKPARTRTGTSSAARAEPPPRRPRSSRRTQLTGRAAVLALVACALVLALTYPTREYFAQQAQIERLRAQTAKERAAVGALQEQKARWHDPAYVKAQARQRLHFVMPGETGFVAVPGGLESSASGDGGAGGSAADEPWFTRLTDSVEGAGAEPAGGSSR